jgi:hypothetical protein
LVNKIARGVLCKSTRTLLHHFSSLLLLLEEKTPTPWTRVNNLRGAARQGSVRFGSEFFLDLLLVLLLDLALHVFLCLFQP